MPDASRITALVGPTNTGKTHRAVERMLEHSSGMIGLPLRLLAREVYDKISARIGEERVALVTGEEQRIPRRPDYWVSTTEAMPVERDVDFVAVDEVQLAATEQRGHVFTSRILSARGRKETWLLGAGTMSRLLSQLVPTAEIASHPRLSSLKFAGKATLGRVPPRSAVVAFSLPHVYELAEKLRVRKGGAAVVLGALSPRTRNAQVAMFQAGEVDYLVATDAIGMGLNLGVSHVAFGSLRKFDGRGARPLEEAELAQIAGRAGRWIEDGTFGTLDPIDLPPSVARDVELHRFPSLQKIRWRNDRLELGSIEELRASLQVPSPRPALVAVHDAEDERALELLLRDPEIGKLARGREAVQRLWDVCTVPDFRKLLFEAHVGFLGELYKVLMQRGRLEDAWIEPRVAELSEIGPGSDVDTLTARIAAARVWTYIANRGSWLEDAARWQEETRAVEDRLSDALHQQLLARFVDARRTHRPSRPLPSKPRVRGSSRDVVEEARSERDLHVDPAHPFAKLAALRSSVRDVSGVVGGERESSASLAGSRGAADEIAEKVIAAGDRDLSFRADGAILHAGRMVGVLVRGPQISLPDARAQIEGHDLGAGARARLQRRLLAFVRGAVAELIPRESALAPSAPGSSFAVRALLHALEPGLGAAPTAALADILAALTADERARLDEERVRPGPWLTYAAAGVTTRALVARHALVRVFHLAAERLPPPPPGIVSFVPRPLGASTAAIHLALGFPLVAGRAIRADVLDRVSRAVLDDLANGDGARPTDGARYASRLGCDRKTATAIVRLLAARAPKLAVAI
jgi:ATP-dependent RNA helicase SUPV3L1/SUV3